MEIVKLKLKNFLFDILVHIHIFYTIFSQTSSDGNQTTSTLSITLSRSDAGKYLSCKAYNHMSPSEALEDGWRLDIQCEYNGKFSHKS
jgi:hypothetical protein